MIMSQNILRALGLCGVFAILVAFDGYHSYQSTGVMLLLALGYAAGIKLLMVYLKKGRVKKSQPMVRLRKTKLEVDV